VAGSDQPPPVTELAAGIAEAVGRPVDVKVDWVPTTTLEATGSP
jgi:hypothetical protein